MLKSNETDQAELNMLLNETFGSTDYCDEEIVHLIKQPILQIKNKNRITIPQDHQIASGDIQSNAQWPSPQKISYHQDQNISSQQHKQQENSNKIIDKDESWPKQFKALKQQSNNFYKLYTTELILQKYPNYVISQPTYTLNKSYHQRIFKYNQTLLQAHISCMDVAYCSIIGEFVVAIGMNDSRVAILYLTNTKPINIWKAFSNSLITCVQWSQKQQYLIVASSGNQVKVYQFKQSVQVQNATILKIRKQPVQLFYLSNKQLECAVMQILWISEEPMKVLLTTENDEILVVEYKKHFINFRPYLSYLPLKFNSVFQLSTVNLSVNDLDVVLLAVSSIQYVTICILYPFFEVLIVYDKEKHGKQVLKNGYSHVHFRKKPLALLIVWDRFVDLLELDITGLQPLRHSICNFGMQILPAPTLAAGLISNTLMYHVSEEGIKIFCLSNFGSEKDLAKPKNSIYNHPINYFQLPNGLNMQEQMKFTVPPISLLRWLDRLVLAKKDHLFLASNTCIWSVRIQDFEEYVRNTIDHYNNWKVGLQLLHDGYLQKYRNFDKMTASNIKQLLHQYCLKYIEFLKVVIEEHNENLWNQEITFIFNILVETKQTYFLFDVFFPKLQHEQLDFLIKYLSPFILQHRIQLITYEGFAIIMHHLGKQRQIIAVLLANLDPALNEDDLPHYLNPLLINAHFYHQFIHLNNLFQHYYTPFALLVAQYTIHAKQQAIQQTAQISQLLAYACLNMIMEINQCRLEKLVTQFERNQRKKKYKDFLEVFVPLLQKFIITILLTCHFQEYLFSYILPNLYKGLCLELLNDLDNKTLNSDTMTSIVVGVPIHLIQNQVYYWKCLLHLFNKSIVKVEVFMPIKYLALWNGTNGQAQIQHLIDQTVQKSRFKIQQQFQSYSKQDTLLPFFYDILPTNHISLIELVGRVIGPSTFLQIVHAIISAPKHREELLFPFFEECIGKMEKRDKKKLKHIMIENLEIFIEIGCAKLCDLLMQHFLPSLPQFLKNPQVNEYALIGFMQNLLEQLSSLDFHCPQYATFDPCSEFMLGLRLHYLQLLAVTGRQQNILSQLQKETYPLDESLRICRKFGVKDAEAYLLVKSGGEGELGAAINLYFKLVFEHMSYLSTSQIQKFKQYVQSITQQCIDVCQKVQSSVHQFNKEWFLISENLGRLKNKVYSMGSAYCAELVCEFIDSQIYRILAMGIVRNGELQSIVQRLEIEIEHTDVKFFQAIIHEILKSHAYQKVMFLLTQETFIEWELETRKSILKSTVQGFRNQPTCNICGGTKGIMMQYNCKHQIHPQCEEDVKQCCICGAECEGIIQRQIDITRKIKRQIYSGGAKQLLNQNQESKKTYRSRMEEFDKQIYNL